MAYVKLDTGILDSTLWEERESALVFITALLLAEPFEVLEPLHQLEVRSLEFTGFDVPPGWYGLAKAAGVGILRRAMVESEAGFKALEKLGHVDQESRSKDFEGRRLVRVDGGFMVMNYMKYRDMDHTAAERQRRLRARRAEGAQSRVTNVTSPVTSRIADADADADAVKDNIKVDKPVDNKAAPRGAAPKRGTRLPTDWLLPKAWGIWALAEQPTWDADYCRRMAVEFRDYWIAVSGQKGTKLDWEATWRNRVRTLGAKRVNGKVVEAAVVPPPPAPCTENGCPEAGKYGTPHGLACAGHFHKYRDMPPPR